MVGQLLLLENIVDIAAFCQGQAIYLVRLLFHPHLPTSTYDGQCLSSHPIPRTTILTEGLSLHGLVWTPQPVQGVESRGVSLVL